MADTHADKYNNKTLGSIDLMEKQERYYYIKFGTGEISRLFILNDHVFRYYMSPSGEFLEYPKPINPGDTAKIIHKEESSYGDAAFLHSTLHDTKHKYIVQTKNINIVFDKITGTMKIHDMRTNGDVLIEYSSLSYVNEKSTQTLYQRSDEYFFGGGMQNGRFTHKGEVINIANTNNWVDGGVTSPCPFYWSTYGYGILRNTWQPGIYDFRDYLNDIITTSHAGEDYDAYYFINSSPRDILRDYYELTGNPLLMPEYAYYEAHLNTFNRDYWVEVDCNIRGAILFEDGKYYKRFKPKDMDGKKGTLESLNGEKNNYQFSARAMIDRYERHDMPLGWFIPNDGYGSGYGQTDSLDGDIQNLKEFSDYSSGKGVKVALWTESNLEPVDPLHPKKGERDLGKEVSKAEVVALKCDVAWIGDGYSFALTAVDNARNIFVKNTKENARPMIIMVDGWAGTQRLSGIWSGDQCGGEWEYIRFHIPTYIGAGLSGIPIVGSDMDGIYAGSLKEVNVRDYQWKAFTPLQLNMDGWGNIPKTPFSFDEEATKINRAYLKLKSILMPYNYTLGHEAINGLPMVRAMFLEFPNETSSYTNDSMYQFMWGPNILVAPIFNDTCTKDMLSIRNGIYLPNKDEVWIDFFTGEVFQGGKIYNNIITPLWKIPVFIKAGSVIPMTKPNNNPREVPRDLRIFTIYPNGESNFTIYEDDGVSSKYLDNQNAFTKVEAHAPKFNARGNLLITINKTHGSYKNMIKERTTLLQIMACNNIDNIKVAINGESVILTEVLTDQEFEQKNNCYFFKEDFVINPYMKEFSENVLQQCLLIKIKKLDVTSNEINIKVNNYSNQTTVFGQTSNIDKTLNIPEDFQVGEEMSVFCIVLKWSPVNGVQYYEIEKDGVVFTNIIGNTFTFKNLTVGSKHAFRIRAVNNNTVSEWSQIVEGITMDSPFNYIILGVNEIYNEPCKAVQEMCNSNDCEMRTGKLIIKYDLGQVYDVDRAEFMQSTCNYLEIQYKWSRDNIEWSASSDIFKCYNDNSPKSIQFDNLKCRYIEFTATNAEMISSGVIFYKK